MANIVTDPRQHHELVVPDFTKPDSLLTFTLDDVAFVYGTKWKQRYPATIVNPARRDYVRANDTCLQRHTQGQPLTDPILGTTIGPWGSIRAGT
jgi:hypothetical protein